MGQLLDINGGGGPSFLTPSTAFAALEACWKENERRPMILIGSSFGGWAAARFSDMHPERVARLLLLNPGFELGSRWPSIVGGHQEMARWQHDGFRRFAMPSDGTPVDVPWSFVEATRS